VCTTSHILVDVDPIKGLYESIDLVLGEHKYTQVLDYENISFFCVHCHKVGHIVMDFALSFHFKNLTLGYEHADAGHLVP
jgi:nitrate/TMAO reductase-like tetraheme cytochrome c subunit